MPHILRHTYPKGDYLVLFSKVKKVLHEKIKDAKFCISVNKIRDDSKKRANESYL